MALGPKDNIDRLLVEKYANEKVNNYDNLPSMVDPDEMLGAMNDYADMHRTMLDLRNKLKNVCSKVNSSSANYRSSLPA